MPERIHRVIENLVQTFNLENNDLDKDDPWSGILAATVFFVQSTYQTKFLATLGQLVFGRDMMLNNPFVYDLEANRRRKKELIDKVTNLKIKPVNGTYT